MAFTSSLLALLTSSFTVFQIRVPESLGMVVWGCGLLATAGILRGRWRAGARPSAYVLQSTTADDQAIATAGIVRPLA
jgi:hypothetical protein